jgi:Cys-rich protein (TIGR01571 family)
LVLYTLFGFLWWIGGAFIGGNYLWIPAVIIFCPIIGYSAYYRMKIRAKYDILGSVLWDFVVDWFCLLCALCQEARHVDRDYGMMV